MRYAIRRRRSAWTIAPSALALLGFSSWVRAQNPPPPAAPAPAPAAPATEVAPPPVAPAPVAPAPLPAPEPAPAAVEPQPAPVVDIDVPPAPAPAAEPAAAPAFDVKVDFGVGLRTEFVIDPSADPDTVYSMNHNLRPYISGQVHDYIKFEGNLDSEGDAANLNIRVLDAVIKFEFNDYFNLWTGHFLPPTDRANLSGPYFQNAWTYPAGVHAYPSQYAGRDDGLAVWGQINGGQFKYQLGVFDMGGGTEDPRFSGRLTFNVLDPEPGYYNSSTYYGTKDVLAIGAVLHHEPQVEGTPDDDADTLWNLDALYENSFADVGTLNVEGAFYGFDGADAGTSFSVLASFLFAGRVGIGQLQPMFRVQSASWSDGDEFGGVTAPADTDASQLTIDGGLHYIINGHNTRLAATVQHTSASVGDVDADPITLFILGAQIQAF